MTAPPIKKNMKIVHSPDIQQITFLDERYYFDENTKTFHPSVSTILDVWPKGWGYNQWLKDLGMNADEVLKRAGEQGTHIHDMIKDFLLEQEIAWTDGEKENYTLEEWLMFLKFVDFYKTWKPETIAVEVSLVDPELGFGGTLDYVCRLPITGDTVWYIDWKSGGAIYKSNKLQGAAYQQLWNKKMKDKITRLGCMHLRAETRGADKTGKRIQGEGWKLDEIENPDHLFSLFQHAQTIWKEENPNPVPKNMVYPDRMSIAFLKAEEEANK